MRSALILVAAALALCACGAVGSGAVASPSATPYPTAPGLGFDVAVNENTHVVTMRVGQKLEAVLHARPGMTAWNGVRSSDPSVLEPIANPAATAARGVTLAAFEALAPGKAQITATAGADCSPGQACPMYAVLLVIDVSVSAG